MTKAIFGNLLSFTDAFQSFYRFVLKVGMEVDVPPLPRMAVEQQIAALR
jgi:hypothetical protein